jgi:hypothetical protein
MALNEIEINDYKDQSTMHACDVHNMSYVNIADEQNAKASLIQDVLMDLGAPLLSIELTDEQIDHCIEDSILIYTKYASFPPQYLGIDLLDYKEDEGINLKKFNIAVISDIAFGPVYGLGMSTSELAFGMSGYISNMPIWRPFNFVSLECMHEFRELAQRMLAPKPSWTFIPQTGILKIMPEPRFCYRQLWENYHSSNGKRPGGHIPAVIECEIEPPLWQLYSNEYVRRLTMAHAKVLLGTIRSKYSNISLPGGGQLDGASMKQEGQLELKELIDNIRQESYGNHFMII